MQTLYQIALITHIIGIAMLAGSTLVDYVLVKQIWKQYAEDKFKAISLNEAVSKLRILFGLGILLLIISGVAMMGVTHGVFGEQIWFRIKFCFIIIIILNGLAIGRRQGLKLTKILSEEMTLGRNSEMALLKVKGTISLFHFSQMIFFLIIFTLSVFKFN